MKVEVVFLAVVCMAAADTKVVFPYHLPLLTSASVAQPVASGIYTHPIIAQYAAPVPIVENAATAIRYSVPATQFAIPSMPATRFANPTAQFAFPAVQYAIPAAQSAIPASQYAIPAAERSVLGAPGVVARTSIVAPSVINIDDDDDIEATAYGIMRPDIDDDLDATRYGALDDDRFEIDEDDDRK